MGMTNKFMWILLFSLTMVIAYVLIAPMLFKMLFPNYLEAVWYSQLFALSLLALPSEAFTTYLSSKRLTQELYVLYIFYSVFQIGSMLIGVIYWGLLGVIVARITTRYLMGALGFVLYKRAIS